MAMLATTDIVADLNTLATTAIVADLAILATTDIVADMALLATSDIVTDLNVLATSDIVTDLSILATTDIVADLAILATTDIVADLAILGTSDIVTDLNVLATTDIVADLNLLATSSVIADMATLAGDGANPNITSVTASGEIAAASLDISGNIDVDGISNLDVVDIDGAVNMATTALVTGVLTANGGAVFNEASADVDFRVESDTSTHALFVQGSDGNVGIGTASPNQKLQVQNTGADTGLSILSDTDQRSLLLFADTGDADIGAIIYDHTSNFMKVHVNNAERMRIDSSGNVGIGNSSPSALSWPNGSSGGLFLQAGALLSAYNAGTVLSQNWYYNGGEKYIANGSASRYSQAGAEHVWSSAGNNTSGAGAGLTWSESMRIDASGNVGIGLANPSDYYAKDLVVAAADEGGITIECGTAEKAYLMFADGTSGTALYSGYIGYDHSIEAFNIVSHGYMNFYTGSSPTEAMRIDVNGNLLVGQTSVAKPTQSNEILTGAMRVNPTLRTAANAANLYWEPSSGVFWRSTSSLRYKQNVQDYTRGISDLMQMRPVTFNNKVNDTTKLFTGFIAEDLHEQGLEEFVEYDGENRPDSVAYANLTSLLTKAIQEQQATIEALTARIAALES